MITHRIFVALDLPADARHELWLLTEGLTGHRRVPEDQLHITLCFIGETPEDEVKRLASALEVIQHQPFEITTGGLGTFGRPPRILHVSVRPEEPVRALAEGIARIAAATIGHGDGHGHGNGNRHGNGHENGDGDGDGDGDGKEIGSEVGSSRGERRPFSPHITLARLKAQRANTLRHFVETHRAAFSRRSPEDRSSLGESIRVDHFTLYASTLSKTGALYEVLRTYPLARFQAKNSD